MNHPDNWKWGSLATCDLRDAVRQRGLMNAMQAITATREQLIAILHGDLDKHPESPEKRTRSGIDKGFSV